jgi:pilus assembly protein CpaC
MEYRNRLSRTRQAVSLILFLALLTAPGGAALRAEAAAWASGPAGWSAPQDVPRELHLMVGRSLVVTSPVRIKRVSIADPDIADAVIVSPHQILINGKVPGVVSFVLWDENDVSQSFDLFVELDVLEISQKIREVFPAEPVNIAVARDTVILTGQISSQAVADRIMEVVTATTPKVVSMMEVPAPPPPAEILLEVKFAEVNRAALSQHGLNIFSLGATNTIGSVTTQQFSPPNLRSLTSEGGQVSDVGFEVTKADFRFSDLLNIFVFRPDLNLGVMIRALEQRNLLQILAEPNLLTQSGKEASFLAGGEFPFPVVQPGQAFTSISIQFREFGVQLNFTPNLTPDGKIHLKVRPEVSALDFANALTISGFVVPALSTRRVETEMELADGQSFAIAGLVDNRVTEVLSKIPGLGDIPILGKLFQSRSKNLSTTELLVVVTPRIVRPMEAGEEADLPDFPKPFLDQEKSKPAGQPGQR